MAIHLPASYIGSAWSAPRIFPGEVMHASAVDAERAVLVWKGRRPRDLVVEFPARTVGKLIQVRNHMSIQLGGGFTSDTWLNHAHNPSTQSPAVDLLPPARFGGHVIWP